MLLARDALDACSKPESKKHHTCPVSLDTTQITKEAESKPFAHVLNDISIYPPCLLYTSDAAAIYSV